MALTKIDDRGLTTPIDLLDSEKIRFGTGNDLELYHVADGNSFINDTATAGQFIIQAVNGHDIKHSNGELAIRTLVDGAVSLYYDGTLKCSTYGDGLNFPDLGTAAFGASNDMKLYHYNDTNYIVSGNGHITTRVPTTKGFRVQKDNGQEDVLYAYADGAVELYYDGAKVLYTNINGVTVHAAEGGDANLYLHADEGDDDIDKWLIQSESDGYFALKNNASGSYETHIKAIPNGAVELYYDNTKRIQTTSDGTDVYGNEVHLYNNVDTSNTYFFAQNTGGGNAGIKLKNTDGEWTIIANDRLRFIDDDAGVERLAIDSTGAVGIAVVPKDNDGNYRHLQIGLGAHFYGRTDDTPIYLSSNGYRDSSSWKYTANTTASRIGLATDMTFKTAVSGTADNAISWQDRMTIHNSSGDVEIHDGDLRVANGHGINFSSTSHVTGVESELLDDYESGTWTAGVATGTCSQQSCNYVKVGRLVTIWGRIHGFSDTTTNIVLKITGLPYTCSTSNAGGSIFSKDVSTAASTTYITTNEDLTFYGQNSSNAWSYITHLSCGSNTEIYFHASYTSAAN